MLQNLLVLRILQRNLTIRRLVWIDWLLQYSLILYWVTWRNILVESLFVIRHLILSFGNNVCVFIPFTVVIVMILNQITISIFIYSVVELFPTRQIRFRNLLLLLRKMSCLLWHLLDLSLVCLRLIL